MSFLNGKKQAGKYRFKIFHFGKRHIQSDKRPCRFRRVHGRGCKSIDVIAAEIIFEESLQTSFVILQLKLGPSRSQQRCPVFQQARDVKVVETQPVARGFFWRQVFTGLFTEQTQSFIILNCHFKWCSQVKMKGKVQYSNCR